MVSRLNQDLQAVWSTVPPHKFQLRSVTYPSILANQYLNSSITSQNTLMYLAQRSADVYRAQTALDVSTILAQAQEVNTSAIATISQIQYIAGAQAFAIRTITEGYGIAAVFDTLNLTDIVLQQDYLLYFRASQNVYAQAIFGFPSLADITSTGTNGSTSG